MFPLSFYRDLRIAYCLSVNPDYDPDKDDGLAGDAFELAVRAYVGHAVKRNLKAGQLAPQGKCDDRIGRRNYEFKTGAGKLSSPRGNRLLAGSGYVLYVPVVDYDLPVDKQEGFFLSREDFLACLDRAGAIRTKPWGNETIYTIQTFWNRSKNKPHGKLLARMLDELYEAGIPLEEYLPTLRK